MKDLIFILPLILTLSLSGQTKKCSDFKTGKFKYTNPKYAQWEITRNDSIQVEVNTKTDIEIHNAIIWKSDCEYILTPIKVQNSNVTYYLGEIFNVQITKTFEDRYFLYIKNDDITDMLFEMIKVE